MADTLQVAPFTADMLDRGRDFHYGDEPYQKDLADWMCHDAIRSLAIGTKIWLYINPTPDIVGYGSLGVTRWRFPDPDSPKTELVIIPAVALRSCYWGKPAGPAEDRYSSQIMRHLLDEAHPWPGQLPGVGLFVHPNNHAAIKLYERFGFRPFSHTFTDRATKVTYLGYLRRLEHILKAGEPLQGPE
jgi:GNAT superfamily N-acetyltransferase